MASTIVLIVSIALSSNAHAIPIMDWTVLQGSWTVSGAVVTGQGISSEIISTQTFPSDRVFQVRVRTLSGGEQTWYTAWILGKYLDECSRILFLIHTSGLLEFNVSVGCSPNQHFVASTLNPFDWHMVKIIFSGNNAKVYVDNTLYIDVTDPAIGAFGDSKVQLASWGPSSATFIAPQIL